jgi:long-chain-alcohol oxidase
MLDYEQTSVIGVFMRDKTEGEVWADKCGNSRVNWKMSKEDQDMMCKGMVQACQVLRAAGATKVGSNHPGVRWTATGDAADDDAAFDDMLETVVAKGVPENIQPYVSAHFMASCRMGKDCNSSALDPTGQTWDVEDLYVIDGSSLPSNIGVNPMVTIESTAYILSHKLAEKLKGASSVVQTTQPSSEAVKAAAATPVPAGIGSANDISGGTFHSKAAE